MKMKQKSNEVGNKYIGLGLKHDQFYMPIFTNAGDDFRTEKNVTKYSTTISTKHEDREWNNFLADTDSFGHHEQTTCWAKIEHLNGWKAFRILVRREGRIVGGAQVLIKRKKLFGAIAYLRWGPYFADEDPKIRHIWAEELNAWAKKNRPTYIIVNPNCRRDDRFISFLESQGYKPKQEKVPPSRLTQATLIIDLSKSLDTILYDMRNEVRRQIRIGTESGLKFEEGFEEDLPVFFKLMKCTAERRGERPVPISLLFVQQLWKSFFPHGWVRLFLVKKSNRVISTGLIFPFGSTVRFWKYGWSGEDARIRPNQFLYWNLIKWSKENGFKFFDIVQIESGIAECLRQKMPLTEQQKAHPFYGPTMFKMGFGGQIFHYPGAYYRSYNPIAGMMFELVVTPLMKVSLLSKLLQRFI